MQSTVRVASRGTAARLPDFLCTPAARRALATACVTVVGSGSIGSLLVLELCRLGLGNLVIIDPGTFKVESALTHLCPTPVGQKKVVALARLCRSFPATAVTAVAAPVSDAPVSLLDADVVALAGDNLACEVAVTELCRRYRVPLMQGSIDGETLVAQVRVLSNASAEDPCLGCGYGAHEWAALDASRKFSCAGSTAEAGAQPATRSPSFLCALAASLLAKEVVLRLVGDRRTVDNAALEYRGFLNQVVRTSLAHRPDCPLDHTAWTTLLIPRPAVSMSAAELMTRAGPPPAGQDWVLCVDGMVYLPGACLACRPQLSEGLSEGPSEGPSAGSSGASSDGTITARSMPGRFRKVRKLLRKCSDCSRFLVPSLDGLDGVALADLPPARRSGPLRALGVVADSSLVLRAGNRSVVVAEKHGVRR